MLQDLNKAVLFSALFFLKVPERRVRWAPQFSCLRTQRPRKATASESCRKSRLFSTLHPQNEHQKENKVMGRDKAGKDAMLMWAEGLDYLGFGEEVIKAGDWIFQSAFCISFLFFLSI